MTKKPFRMYFVLAGITLGCWFFVRYGLPVGLPFLLGGAVALAAEGTTRVCGTGHIDRGYEDIARDLRALGAAVSRTE